MPGGQLARSLACKSKKAHEQVTTGPPNNPALPARLVLTVFFVLSPETGFLSPSPAQRVSVVAVLTPASGRRDHTTSPSASYALVLRMTGVHRILHPTFVTIAKRPS